MKKLIVLMLILCLLFPAVAFAKGAPVDKSVEDDSARTITVFGYVIVVVPPAEEGQAVCIGVFKIGEDGDAEEEVTSFTLGGVLGQSVCKVANTVEAGAEHGKVVSTFVKKVNEEKRAAKKAEIEAKKAKKKAAVEEKKVKEKKRPKDKKKYQIR